MKKEKLRVSFPVSFKVTTFGCPVNQYEGKAIAAAMKEAGFVEAGKRTGKKADVYIINSCAVTSSAAREARRAARKAKRENPESLVVLVGCYPQVEGERLARDLPEADILVGTVGRSKLPQVIREFLAGTPVPSTRHENLFSREFLMGTLVPSIKHENLFSWEQYGLLKGLRPGVAGGRKYNDKEAAGGRRCSVKEAAGGRRCSVKEAAGDKKRFPKVLVQHHGRRDPFEELPVPLDYGKMRPVLKIQEGCDEFCTYCTVIKARGWPRSLHPDKVLEQAEQLLKRGYREIVLAGTHLGIYGEDLAKGQDLAEGRYGGCNLTRKPKTPCSRKELAEVRRGGCSPRSDFNLARLLQRICRLPYDFRVRLGYIEPMNVKGELLEAVASLSKVCNHLYVPLQSGSDKVLARMGRRYTAEEFAGIVCKARQLMPGASIWTDLIAGFPGEEEDDHRKTVELVKMLEIDRLHVFPYSPRPGTPAARFAGQVRPDVKKRRSEELKELGRKLALNFYRKTLGSELRVLVEKVVEGYEHPQRGIWIEGYSDNYIRIRASAKLGEPGAKLGEPGAKLGEPGAKPAAHLNLAVAAGELRGEFVTVKAEKAYSWGIAGTVI